METFAEALQRNFPDVALPPAALTRLTSLVPLRSLAAGATLFAQGQPTHAFYLVAAGEIEARLTGADGGASVLEHVQPPRLFGLAAFVTGAPAAYEAAAVGPSKVWVIGAPAYRLLMDEVPGLARALLREFARRFEGNLRLLEAARHRSADERFALALAQLARERGAPADAEGWIELRATQTELAALAHLSRQTVNELLRAGAAAARLRSGYGRLWIKAPLP